VVSFEEKLTAKLKELGYTLISFEVGVDGCDRGKVTDGNDYAYFAYHFAASKVTYGDFIINKIIACVKEQFKLTHK
jgi:hypothetical protein